MTSSSSLTYVESNGLQKLTTNSSKLSALGLPSSFKVLNHTINVKEIPSLPDMGRAGDYDASLNEIRLFTEGVCDDVVIQTFYHELIHCFEDKANLAEIPSEEARCDIIGGMLAQYLDTKQ